MARNKQLVMEVKRNIFEFVNAHLLYLKLLMLPSLTPAISLPPIFNSIKSKLWLILLSLLGPFLLQAQQIDVCQYFHLDISTREEDGQVIRSYSPDIKPGQQDAVSAFIAQHANRFSYLLWNKLEDLGPVADIYPDTSTMDAVFCDLMHSNQLFLFYLNNLLPASLRNPGTNPDTFSVDEMMLVASRFFYCLEIQESDTVVISHICVSIKDQESIPFRRDMTLLEAFAFEGIFYALLNEEKPRFDANFKRYINESTGRHKNEIPNLDKLLVTVRHECFALMEDDQDLNQSLLRYYRDNRDNLNFIID